MTLATLPPRTALAQAPDPPEAAWSQRVEPGRETLLMPASLGRLVTEALAGRPARINPLGWIFAACGQWGIFLPEESDEPA